MTRPTSPAVNFDSVPTELRSLNRWCLWKFVQKKRKDGTQVWTKLPITRAGKPASSTDASTWCAFDEIQDAYLFGTVPNDGVGITFDGSDQLVGIDLDDCIDVLGNYTPLAQEVLDRVPGYAEVSPSGTGVKLWTRAVCDSHKTSEGAPDAVEIYPHGRYFTVTGAELTTSSADDFTLRNTAIPTEPVDLSWLVARVFGPGAVRQRTQPSAGAQQADGSDADADALALYRRPLDGWPLERVQEELLPVLDPGCSYDEWLQIGAALHHQGEGDEEWLELWDTWSAGSAEKWAEGYCQEKWESFHTQRVSGRGPVTLATVLKLVADAKTRMQADVRNEWAGRIAAAASGIELEGKVCEAIAKDVRLDEVAREFLVQNHLKQRLKQLGNVLPVAQIRKLVAPALTTAKGTNVGPRTNGLPDWAQDWVYLTSEDRFLHLGDKRKVTPQGFNFMYDRELLPLAGDEPVSASRFVKDMGMDHVSAELYAPNQPLRFEYLGLQCVNTYRPDRLPAVPPEWDAVSVDAAWLCESHVIKLFGGNRDTAYILLDWMAWCVQNPGVPVQWAPLIKGAEGDGKSILAKMLRAAMGADNVKEVSTKALSDGFTGWGEGACVRILEELRIHSGSRLDLLDVIKPYLTNDYVTVRRMRTDEYVAPNTQSYLGFTNHTDALPLSDMDRRWWIAFTNTQTKEDVAREYPPGYFNRLHNAIDLHPGAVRRWLLEWSVRGVFNRHGPAPMSEAKAIMAGSNKSEDDWTVETLVNTGGAGYSAAVVSTSHLRGAIAAAGEHLSDHRYGISRTLTRLGFVQCPHTVWWDGTARRVWVKDGKLLLDKANVNACLKNLLDSTVRDDESAT